MIVWHEPIQTPSGRWAAQVDNLHNRAANVLIHHEVLCLIHINWDGATVTFDTGWVLIYGVQRCWWLLREDICEEEVFLSVEWEGAIAEAMPAGDDDEDRPCGWIDYVG